jgi:electron transport complex protein RnfC
MTASDIQLRHFHGGLHLPANKVVSTSQPVRRVPLPSRLVLPLQQHIGEPATPLVKIGDRVLKGQSRGPRDLSAYPATHPVPAPWLISANDPYRIPPVSA